MVDLLRHQVKSDKFDLEFTDYSIKEPYEDRWKMRCTERIRNSSVVVIMIGEHTHEREAVKWEISKAYELGKPVIGVRMHRNANHKVPEEMQRNGAKVVNWNMTDIQEAVDDA